MIDLKGDYEGDLEEGDWTYRLVNKSVGESTPFSTLSRFSFKGKIDNNDNYFRINRCNWKIVN